MSGHVDTLSVEVETLKRQLEEKENALKAAQEKAEAEAAAAAAAAAEKAKEGEGEGEVSKKELKRREKEAAKAAKKAAQEAAQKAAQAVQFDPEEFGPMPLVESKAQSGYTWTDVSALTPEMEGKEVRIRARISTSRKASAALAFVVLRKQINTVQCVFSEKSEATPVKRDHIKWVTQLPLESIVEITGVVTLPKEPVKSCTQSDVEIAVKTTFCVSASQPVLPFQIADAAGLTDIEVKQDSRLDTRWLDMRTPANLSIWTVKSRVCQYFRQFLTNNGFLEIQTPKLIPAASESGASVFRLNYFDTTACLAQSPQLYKQMVLMGDLKRVFEVGPVFRAEQSNTHRHLCEFVGLDVEMEIKEHYYEVLDVAEGLFTSIFDNLRTHCQKYIDTVHAQFNATPFEHKMTPETIERLGVGIIDGDEKRESKDEYGALIKDRSVATLRMTYPNAIRLLNTVLGEPTEDEAMKQFAEQEKMEVTADLSTTNEKMLGKLVKQRYGVDFFIVDWFPQSVRPFYTMPCPHDNRFSNSYDMFMRGEEISSGAQRIHDAELLESRLEGMDEAGKATLRDYINSFRLGGWPHGGFGVGLERVVMLYLGLHNIRSCSMFPRTPIRHTP